MITLGIHAYTHDSAAAIVKNGEIVAAVEEERFNGCKHTDAFPVQSIGYCLKTAGTVLSKVDVVAVAWQPMHRLDQRLISVLKYFPKSLVGMRPSPDKHIRGNLDIWNSLRNIPRKLQKTFGRAPTTKFIFLRHHDCHAASAFLVSSLDKAAVVTCDACGEWDTTVFYKAHNETMARLSSDPMPHSLGLVYGAFTQYLGYREKSDEGKVMALASMAPPAYLDQMEKLFRLDPRGSLRVATDHFRFHYDTKNRLYSQKLVQRFGPPPASGDNPSTRSKQVAASLQAQCENVLAGMFKKASRLTGDRDFCLAGGVALNSKANGWLVEQRVVDRLFVQPAANDAGTAMGAALLAFVSQGGGRIKRKPFSPYLGPESAINDCRGEIAAAGLFCRELHQPAEIGAGLLVQGQVLGWHQGRMEWGPRALGNRSILADPRDIRTKVRVNAKVKFRESFRPFAPAILQAAQKDYFRCEHPVPHMTHVLTVRENMVGHIPAVVHVDGTARLQTVTKEDNPKFEDLIQAFYRRTGVPIIMNTSLNLNGMPIAAGAQQSIRCLTDSDLDFVIIGNLAVCKSEDKLALLDAVENELR